MPWGIENLRKLGQVSTRSSQSELRPVTLKKMVRGLERISSVGSWESCSLVSHLNFRDEWTQRLSQGQRRQAASQCSIPDLLACLYRSQSRAGTFSKLCSCEQNFSVFTKRTWNRWQDIIISQLPLLLSLMVVGRGVTKSSELNWKTKSPFLTQCKHTWKHTSNLVTHIF